MKKKINVIRLGLIILTLQLITHHSFSQNVGINSDGSNGDSNTMLDIKSTDNTSSSFGLKVKDSGGNDKMVVRSDGRVGIGISSPQALLDVNTESAEPTMIRINGEVSQKKYLQVRHFDATELSIDNNFAYITSGEADKGMLGHTTNLGVDVDVLTWTQTGEVGIGTTSPLDPFHVSIDADDTRISARSGGLGQSQFIVLDNTHDAELQLASNYSLGNARIWQLRAETDDNSYRIARNGNDYLTMSSAGEVGIGTTPNTGRILHLLGSTGNTFARMEYPTSGQASIEFTEGNNVEGYLQFFGTGTDHRMRFFVGGGGSQDMKMTIMESGKVGIGTATPSSELHVFGDGNTSASSAMNIADNGGNALLFVRDDGNVGIGSTSPSQALHVVGNICHTGSVSACSDIRYKKNIQPLTNALDQLTQLKGVHYYWKQKKFPEQKFTDEKQIGFIAQDLEKVYPELVTTDDQGYKSVNYARLTPILVEAIKELNDENQRLKANDEILKSEVKELKAMVNDLYNTVETSELKE